MYVSPLRFTIIFISLIISSVSSIAQSQIDHWETAVFAEDNWHYFVGTVAPDPNWNSPLFAPNDWNVGAGGIGYGDEDDNTIIGATTSLYMRRQFTVFDKNQIEMALLHADYDDAFVAYLNGVEIARSNIGEVGTPPEHDQVSDGYREAAMYEGGQPIDYHISKEVLSSVLRDGPNILAIQVHNQSFDSSDLSAIFFLSLAINDETTLYEPTPDWFVEPLILSSSSNLPLVLIDTDGQNIVDDPRVTARMGIIDNGAGVRNNWTDPYNHFDGQISIEIRGNSSQYFDKKNYSLETQDSNGDNLNVSLLGMPKENDWVLHGPYSDKSLMRNDLTYHIGRIMGRYAPRTRYCELMINGQYLGIYVLTEKIKRDVNRVDIAQVKPEDTTGDELSGGYLLKIDWDNGHPEDGFYSTYPPYQFYSFVEPDFDELQPVQQNYIQDYIHDFEDAMDGQFLINFSDYIDVPSFVDYVISNELGKEVDAYRLSAYLYKKKDSNGGKLHFGPLWDFNLGYGNYDYCPEQPQGWAYQFNTTCQSPLPFWINKLMVTPEIRNAMNCRWFELRQTVLQTDLLMEYIDTRAAQLEEAQARNFDQWRILGQYVWPNSFVGSTYQQEIDFMKNWLTQRLWWMDANMVGTCLVATEDLSSTATGMVQVFPNPFEETVVFQWSKNLEDATMLIFDLVGREVAVLPVSKIDQQVVWDGIGRDGHVSSVGLYTYILKSNGKIIDTGKVLQQ